jgi:hypothetical protein
MNLLSNLFSQSLSVDLHEAMKVGLPRRHDIHTDGAESSILEDRVGWPGGRPRILLR